MSATGERDPDKWPEVLRNTRSTQHSQTAAVTATPNALYPLSRPTALYGALVYILENDHGAIAGSSRNSQCEARALVPLSLDPL